LALDRDLGRQLRDARHAAGLSLRIVAGAAGISPSELSRIERGLAPWLSIERASRLSAIVGLDLWLRTYPAGDPLRDAAHAALQADFRRLVHGGVHISVEVPIGPPGDLRGWDMVLRAGTDRAGSEFETRLHDAQALARRVQLKLRDSGLSVALIVVRDTAANRAAYAASRAIFDALCPVSGHAALMSLRSGRLPAASAVVFLRRTTAAAAVGRQLQSVSPSSGRPAPDTCRRTGQRRRSCRGSACPAQGRL
jgi:transcriptional regulator with XRE-family HTH domain